MNPETIVHTVEIDWAWLRKELFRAERIKNDNIAIIAGSCIEMAKGLVRPRVKSVIKHIIGISEGFIEIEGPIKFSTSKLPHYVRGTEHLHLFIVSIGDSLEKKATQLMNSDEALQGYLLDRIGSFAVESLAEDVEKKIRSHFKDKDKSISMRLSPGYCDWRVEEQIILDKVVGFSDIGVSLNEKFMMVPKKSISAIIAVGDKNIFSEKVSQCSICESKSCAYRRHGKV